MENTGNCLGGCCCRKSFCIFNFHVGTVICSSKLLVKGRGQIHSAYKEEILESLKSKAAYVVTHTGSSSKLSRFNNKDVMGGNSELLAHLMRQFWPTHCDVSRSKSSRCDLMTCSRFALVFSLCDSCAIDFLFSVLAQISPVSVRQSEQKNTRIMRSSEGLYSSVWSSSSRMCGNQSSILRFKRFQSHFFLPGVVPLQNQDYLR